MSATADGALITPRPAHDRASSSRLVALGGLAVGAVLALVAGSRAWWRAAGTGISVTFTGTESSGGLAQALALVVLAGVLLGLVLRSRGRRVLGVLLVLTGAGVLVLGLTRSRPASGTVRSRVLEVSLADQFALVGTAWPYVFAFAGLLVVGAAGVMTLTASRWPSRAARYERPATGPAGTAVPTGPAGTTPVAAEARRDDDPAALWRLLDAGVDPTTADARPDDRAGAQGDEEPGGDRSSGRAVVQEQPPGVTMNARAAARTDEPT